MSLLLTFWMKRDTRNIENRREKRVVLCKATSSKSSGKSSEEKSILDWVLSGMQKEDQFFETDPILQKKVVDEDEGPTAPRKGTVSVSAPKKKTGGFGGLFAK